MVYIREAHPTDGDRPLRGARALADPRTLVERQHAAHTCARDLELTMPMLIDEIDDGAARAYGAYPDRLYIVDAQGRIAYRGGPGPGGFRPAEMEAALKELLGRSKRPRRLRI